MQATFFYLERFMKKLADDQCSSITRSSTYYIKHMYIHPFTTVVDLPEIGCVMEVSTVFYTLFADTAFYLVRGLSSVPSNRDHL